MSDVRRAVLAAAQEMHEVGLVAGTAGNVSGRLAGDKVCMTPSSLPYPDMTLDDLVVVEVDGTQVDGHRAPTTELALHLSCYRRYPEVSGVVHSHAPHASMFAVAGKPIPAAIEEFVIYVGGEVPVAPYEFTGSEELGEVAAEHLGNRSAVLLANHGMVCVGKDVADALHAAMVVEHNARILWGAQVLGDIQPIPDDGAEGLGEIYQAIRTGWNT